MPVTIEEADVRAFLRILKTLFGVPSQDDAAAHAATQVLIHQLMQQVQNMSQTVGAQFDAQDAKIDQLVTSVGSLEQRVAAQDSKLTAAQTERDAAVADLASTKATLTEVQAQLAAAPVPAPEPAPEPAPTPAPATDPAPASGDQPSGTGTAL
jgi:septal ring factor EnvC (AmiA/AmiB activator)